jgi:hypothetical protein
MGLPGSGATTIVYNTRERLVSTDPNRAQAINAKQIAEILRFLLDAQNEQDVSGGGVETMGTGSELFLRGTILSGVRPRPEVGTTNLFVEPGVALLIDNAAPSSDDSVGAYVADAGVKLAGALTLTAGAGSPRIDVVECQRVTNVTEQDNRDVFNVSTGLFTPTQVPKVKGGALSYRIRTGTPGAGFPGVAAGWLPLMVAMVPAGATTWDQVTCWDVRPLASDRTNGPFQTSRLWPSNVRTLIACDATTNAAQVRIAGEIDLTFKGYKAGGVLRKDSSTAYIDATDAANQQNGFAGFGTTLGTTWYLYLVFPFGLPRWVRYSDSSSGLRQPGCQRGIPAVSANPCNFDGTPRAANVQSPAATNLQDPGSQNAIASYAGRGPKAGGATPFGCHADGRVQMLVNPDAFAIAPISSSTSIIRWAFNDQNNFPGNARAVWLRLHARVPIPDAGGGRARRRDDPKLDHGLGHGRERREPSGGRPSRATARRTSIRTRAARARRRASTSCASSTRPRAAAADLPHEHEPRRPRDVDAQRAAITPATMSATVVGWELGP